MKDKPISILIQEAKNDIAEAINKQELHSSILRMLLKEIYDEVCMLDSQIVTKEKADYENSLKSSDKGE